MGLNWLHHASKNNTHYVDITGENFWVKGLIENHHEEASSKGIRIIPSCGFDSIPSDLGTFFAAKSFGHNLSKELNHFIRIREEHQEVPLKQCFPWVSLDLGDDLTDPFLLNPEDSYSNKQKQLSSDRVGIAKRT